MVKSAKKKSLRSKNMNSLKTRRKSLKRSLKYKKFNKKGGDPHQQTDSRSGRTPSRGSIRPGSGSVKRPSKLATYLTGSARVLARGIGMRGVLPQGAGTGSRRNRPGSRSGNKNQSSNPSKGNSTLPGVNKRHSNTQYTLDELKLQ